MLSALSASSVKTNMLHKYLHKNTLGRHYRECDAW